MKELNHFYLEHPALYDLDDSTEGFEWIDNLDCDRSIIIYLRKSEHGQILLIACNFTPNAYKEYRVGVPFAGKYKEVFNSDKVIYGGAGNTNPRVKQAKAIPMHEREHSILITIPPMGITIFQCTPSSQTEEKKKPSSKEKPESVVKEAKSETKISKKKPRARKKKK